MHGFNLEPPFRILGGQEIYAVNAFHWIFHQIWITRLFKVIDPKGKPGKEFIKFAFDFFNKTLIENYNK